MKDAEYYEKRKRNNQAAQKSRAIRNRAIRQANLRFQQLQTEREELEFEIGQQVMIMLNIKEQMQNSENFNTHVMRFAEEKQLNQFFNVLKIE